MKKHQKNKLTMYRLVERILEENAIVWNTIPGFVTTKNAFSSLINLLHVISGEQMETVTGIAVDKRIMKKDLATHAASIGGVVVAYASQISNAELLDSVRFSQRKLFKLRDNRMAATCQNIADAAFAHAAAISVYGITLAQINLLKNEINNFRDKTPQPRSAYIHKHTLLLNLIDDFKKADNLLKIELDNLLLQFKISNPNFYNSYKASREIIDRGTVHTKLRIMVRDRQGTPLEGAKVSLVQNDHNVYTHTTGPNGEARITLVKPGIYNLEVQHVGYNKWSLPEITFISGKRVSRTAVLSQGLSY